MHMLRASARATVTSRIASNQKLISLAGRGDEMCVSQQLMKKIQAPRVTRWTTPTKSSTVE